MPHLTSSHKIKNITGNLINSNTVQSGNKHSYIHRHTNTFTNYYNSFTLNRQSINKKQCALIQINSRYAWAKWHALALISSKVHQQLREEIVGSVKNHPLIQMSKCAYCSQSWMSWSCRTIKQLSLSLHS